MSHFRKREWMKRFSFCAKLNRFFTKWKTQLCLTAGRCRSIGTKHWLCTAFFVKETFNQSNLSQFSPEACCSLYDGKNTDIWRHTILHILLYLYFYYQAILLFLHVGFKSWQFMGLVKPSSGRTSTGSVGLGLTFWTQCKLYYRQTRSVPITLQIYGQILKRKDSIF